MGDHKPTVTKERVDGVDDFVLHRAPLLPHAAPVERAFAVVRYSSTIILSCTKPWQDLDVFQ
jgi:hypothetical protein